MIGVTFDKVGKVYAITPVNKRQRLKAKILNKWFGFRYRERGINYRQALSDVSFSVEKGEALAFIGRNGAGKSTLLKIVNGTLQHDSGSVVVNGKVGGLIELGAGLSSTKSGYENAIERARLLGVKERQLGAFVKAIEDFSELGDQFFDPVNTYSSGMKSRLGFSISVSLPFDILICDEALSVGDGSFAAKCLAKIRELKQERVFLFVSHSMTQVQRFCERAVVVDLGKVKYIGPSKKAVAFYENKLLNLKSENVVIDKVSKTNNKQLLPSVVPGPTPSYLQPILHNSNKVKEWGVHVEQEGSRGIVIRWRFLLSEVGGRVFRLGFPVFSTDGVMVMSCTKESLVTMESEVLGRLVIPWHGLNPGVYRIVIALYDEIEPILRECISEILIESNGEPYFGIYNVPHEWELGS